MYNLQYHLAHHINARNFLCNECPRAYNTAADLAQHQRIHEKQRDPYKCNDCGMLFQIRSKYNTHMRIHQTSVTKGPKECPICNKTFVCLASHNRIVHLGLRSYECHDCGKSFGKKSGLDRHVLTVHQKVKGYKCEVEGCLGAFGEKSQLTKHMKTHTVRDLSYCSFCKENFDDIKSHFETEHHDLTNHCKICFRRFAKQSSLKVHVKVFHIREKNFFCDFCPRKGFAERFQLKRHLKRHQDLIKLEDKLERNDESFNESDTNDFLDLETEKIFVNDIKVETELFQEPSQLIDTLVEIKKEVVSDEELMQIKIEPEIDIKIEDNGVFVSEVMKAPEFVDSLKHCDDKELTVEDKNHHLDDPTTEFCIGCGDNFPSKSEMQEHFDVKHRRDSSGVSCETCDLPFSRMDHLKAHFIARHTGNQFNCDECGRSFRYKSALDRHVKVIHENQREHICSKCGKTFGSKYDLMKHYETSHDDVKKAQRTCMTCGKLFSKERNLQIHILAIHGEKSFECEKCGKKFSFESAKDRHVKVVHLNQRSHQCDFCKKTFGVKNDLRDHIAFHHNSDSGLPGKYFCTTCERQFASASGLSRHIKGVHENIKQKRPRDYRCKFCKEVMTNKYQKEKHLAQVHQDGLKTTRTCHLCNSDFYLYSEFKSHVESHLDAFICLICGYNHQSLEALNLHSDEHKHIDVNLRKFICDFCGHRIFNKIQLKVHMRKHMSDKNFYVCDICGQGYKYISPFLYHKKVHEGTKDFVRFFS